MAVRPQRTTRNSQKTPMEDDFHLIFSQSQAGRTKMEWHAEEEEDDNLTLFILQIQHTQLTLPRRE